MKIPTGSSAEIEYPSSDGERMSENQWQLDAMIDAINVLRTHFADCPGVYVSGDLLTGSQSAQRRTRIGPPAALRRGSWSGSSRRASSRP